MRPGTVAVACAALLAGACLPRSSQAPASARAPAARVAPVLAALPEPTYDGAIRIASIFPTLGRYAHSGLQSENGARLAVDDINRRGIHGRALRLLAYRTGSYFVDARQAAEIAVEQGGVLAIVGSNSSSLSMPIAEIAETRGVVQVSNISTAEDLTWDPATGRERRFVFRVCASDAQLAAVLARFARERLAARRVALLYEVGRAYSQRLARNFMRRFLGAEDGEREVREFFYLPLEIDFRPQLREIGAFDPDVLFVPGASTDATLIAVQARPLALRATLLGADGWSQRGLFTHGGPEKTAYYADLCAPPEEFRSRYLRTFGEEMEGCRAALAYDAVQAVARALSDLGPLRETDLRESLPATRRELRARLGAADLKGVTGRIRFGPHRDREGGVAIVTVSQSDGRGYVHRFELLPDAS